MGRRAQHDPADHGGVVMRRRGQQIGQVAVEQDVAVAQQEPRIQPVACAQHRAAGAGLPGHRNRRHADIARQAGRDGVRRVVGQVACIVAEQQELLDTEADELAQQPGECRAVATGQQW